MSLNLGVIWEMSVKGAYQDEGRHHLGAAVELPKKYHIDHFLKKEFRGRAIDDGILTLGLESTTTKQVSDFYIQNPFTNYNEFEDIDYHINKSARNVYMKKLKREIGSQKILIDVMLAWCICLKDNSAHKHNIIKQI